MPFTTTWHNLLENIEELENRIAELTKFRSGRSFRDSEASE